MKVRYNNSYESPFELIIPDGDPEALKKIDFERTDAPGHSDALRTYVYTWNQDTPKTVGTAQLLATTHHSQPTDEARVLGAYGQFPN